MQTCTIYMLAVQQATRTKTNCLTSSVIIDYRNIN